MKILIFLFTFLGIAQVLDAQTSKGTFLLGGNASFQRAKEQSILSINPNVGYFVADRFVAGLNAGINSLSDLTFISLGPNLRGYFLTSEKGSIFATAGFNYVRVNIYNNSDSSTGYNLGIGYAVFLNKAIALEISSNYSKLGSSADNIVIGNSETGIFSINVGFQIHFNKNN